MYPIDPRMVAGLLLIYVVWGVTVTTLELIYGPWIACPIIAASAAFVLWKGGVWDAFTGD